MSTAQRLLRLVVYLAAGYWVLTKAIECTRYVACTQAYHNEACLKEYAP